VNKDMSEREYLEKCDGLAFIPGEEGETEIRFMTFYEPMKGKVQVSSSGGVHYHVCFLKYDESDNLVFDDSFDAIFMDPLEYIKGLIGTNIYGTMIKKRENSDVWFQKYLTEIKERVKLT
jgi:hypothetical protein